MTTNQLRKQIVNSRISTSTLAAKSGLHIQTIYRFMRGMNVRFKTEMKMSRGISRFTRKALKG